MTSPRDLIVTLNSLRLGDLDVLRARLEAVRAELLVMDQPELADSLKTAVECLETGQVSEYKRIVSRVVSRLGHVRQAPGT